MTFSCLTLLTHSIPFIRVYLTLFFNFVDRQCVEHLTIDSLEVHEMREFVWWPAEAIVNCIGIAG